MDKQKFELKDPPGPKPKAPAVEEPKPELTEEMKAAYATLGLDKDATREQVEQRYMILLRKSKARQQRSDDPSAGETVDLSAVNRAYNLILGLEIEKEHPQEKQSKVSYFFYYYKVHLIVTIVVLLVAGFTIKGVIDNKREAARLGPADAQVMLFGDFYGADTVKLEANMMNLAPDWNRIQTDLTYVPTEIRSEQDMALQQKSVLVLMTEKPDLMIVDRKNFESLAFQGVFQQLESLPGWAERRVASDRLVAFKAEKDTEEHFYGIRIPKNHPMLADVNLYGEEFILAVRVASAHPDNVPRLLDMYLSRPR